MAAEVKAMEKIAEPAKEEAVAATAESESTLDLEVKHELQTTWKFWYFEPSKDRGSNWEDNLRVVSSFTTVEDFWSIFNHIKGASDLRMGSSYFVFKDGLKPMWEDPGNRAGGRWLVSLDKRNRSNLDNFWLEVLLCLIGEAFDDDGDDVCGAVVDCRGKQDKISIWTADHKNKDRVMAIGRKIKERLQLPHNLLTYESHESTATKSSSQVKHLYLI